MSAPPPEPVLRRWWAPRISPFADVIDEMLRADRDATVGAGWFADTVTTADKLVHCGGFLIVLDRN